MPFDFITPITNNFLHFTIIKLPDLSGDEFAHSVVAFWEGLNEAMQNNNIPQLNSFVTKAFNETASGRYLSPKKNFFNT
jgi:hypothetical protein